VIAFLLYMRIFIFLDGFDDILSFRGPCLFVPFSVLSCIYSSYFLSVVCFFVMLHNLAIRHFNVLCCQGNYQDFRAARGRLFQIPVLYLSSMQCVCRLSACLALLLSKKKGADEYDVALSLKGATVKEGGPAEEKKKIMFTVRLGFYCVGV
jgi:hypothetical protein